MPKKSKKTNEAKILWVEGRWTSDPIFIPSLRKKGFFVDIVSNGKAALDYIDSEEPALVIIDAASMRTSGKRICNSIREMANGLPIMMISDPEKNIRNDNCANTNLVLPFTSRKLVNRIEPMLPADEKKIVVAGPIKINSDRKQVTCYGKKTSLTPRLMRLLKMLLEFQGEVVKRDDLFKKVWRTNYTGDTRTLDVHISWLREAIEKDPKKPKLLTTIRGIGYRLDV
ncbi:MAG: response regulator transcription factor [Chloroflexi bacterium]|nr:response regulator transcription factor [Chloroflexota bacterium]MBT3669434.1 response regulator transcription factor [Chloroflexota bacterium]MBT4004206.1 response regulator transcription factor [Chloroflexota bacterium]MBT4304547.1 response regulator transcription factor [Chloroflexota bacterium]MBT4534112.1 response regulator transcription factor [Chloroflexota bacterium]